jgi:hypothetical protein
MFAKLSLDSCKNRNAFKYERIKGALSFACHPHLVGPAAYHEPKSVIMAAFLMAFRPTSGVKLRFSRH